MRALLTMLLTLGPRAQQCRQLHGPARPVLRFTADAGGKAQDMAFSVLFGEAEHLSVRPS